MGDSRPQRVRVYDSHGRNHGSRQEGGREQYLSACIWSTSMKQRETETERGERQRWKKREGGEREWLVTRNNVGF